MDKRQRELEALVATQKEQLSRYEKRLKGKSLCNKQNVNAANN